MTTTHTDINLVPTHTTTTNHVETSYLNTMRLDFEKKIQVCIENNEVLRQENAKLKADHYNESAHLKAEHIRLGQHTQVEIHSRQQEMQSKLDITHQGLMKETHTVAELRAELDTLYSVRHTLEITQRDLHHERSENTKLRVEVDASRGLKLSHDQWMEENRQLKERLQITSTHLSKLQINRDAELDKVNQRHSIELQQLRAHPNNEIDKMKGIIERLTSTKDHGNIEIDNIKQNEIHAMKELYAKKMQLIQFEHSEKIKQLEMTILAQNNDMKSLNEVMQKQVLSLNHKHTEECRHVETEKTKDIAEIKLRYEKLLHEAQQQTGLDTHQKRLDFENIKKTHQLELEKL